MHGNKQILKTCHVFFQILEALVYHFIYLNSSLLANRGLVLKQLLDELLHNLQVHIVACPDFTLLHLLLVLSNELIAFLGLWELLSDAHLADRLRDFACWRQSLDSGEVIFNAPE